jgi:ElaB/YqjD/DUF883 family membrane-anchored ribosome-binding protein
MDQHQVETAVSDAVAQVGDSVDELTGKTGKTMQEKIDQGKPAFRDLQESAGAALDKAGDLAQKASAAGVQAVDAVQSVARDVANHASQTATAVYQQGARAGGSISRYAAEQPLTALLVAAAIGYGIAYLIHRS